MNAPFLDSLNLYRSNLFNFLTTSLGQIVLQRAIENHINIKVKSEKSDLDLMALVLNSNKQYWFKSLIRIYPSFFRRNHSPNYMKTARSEFSKWLISDDDFAEKSFIELKQIIYDAEKTDKYGAIDLLSGIFVKIIDWYSGSPMCSDWRKMKLITPVWIDLIDSPDKIIQSAALSNLSHFIQAPKENDKILWQKWYDKVFEKCPKNCIGS